MRTQNEPIYNKVVAKSNLETQETWSWSRWHSPVLLWLCEGQVIQPRWFQHNLLWTHRTKHKSGIYMNKKNKNKEQKIKIIELNTIKNKLREYKNNLHASREMQTTTSLPGQSL